jgi:hypothetical protein
MQGRALSPRPLRRCQRQALQLSGTCVPDDFSCDASADEGICLAAWWRWMSCCHTSFGRCFLPNKASTSDGCPGSFIVANPTRWRWRSWRKKPKRAKNKGGLEIETMYLTFSNLPTTPRNINPIAEEGLIFFVQIFNQVPASKFSSHERLSSGHFHS